MKNITTTFKAILAIAVLLTSIDTQAQYVTSENFSEKAFIASLAKEDAGQAHYQQVFEEMDQSINKQLEAFTSFSKENSTLSAISTDNPQEYHKEIFSETNAALNNQLEALTSFTKVDYTQTAVPEKGK